MQQIVYIANPEKQQIDVWQMDYQGELSRLQVVSSQGEVQPLALHPYLPILYAGIRPQFRVQAYCIATDGTLSEQGSAPLPGGANYISVDSTGHYLFCASYHHGSLSCIPIDKQGLPQQPSCIIDGLAGCHSTNLDISNRWLWAPALKQDRICFYPLDENGELLDKVSYQINSKIGAGPRHMAFYPTGRYAYSINELASTIDVWDIDNPSTQVINLQNVDIMPAGFAGVRWAADLHITPDGRYLYACDRTSSLITCLATSEQGVHLTLIDFQPTEQQPRGFAIDNQGDYLIATGQKSDQMAVYRINQESGALKLLARYPVGKGAMWVVIRPLTTR